MAADKENVAAIMKAKQAAGKQMSKSISPRNSLTITQLRLRRLRPPPRSKALSLFLHVSVVGMVGKCLRGSSDAGALY
jgi:hypothetical protein